MKNIQNKVLLLLIPLYYLFVIIPIKANDIEKIQIIDNKYYINTLKLQDFDGKNFIFEDKKARYFIINLWASWCAPCIKEMKSLDSLKKNNPDIMVITISEDKDIEDAKNFFVKNDYKNLEKFYDFDKKFVSQIKIRGLPTTFIADSQYNIFAKVEGAIDWNSKEFINWLYKN